MKFIGAILLLLVTFQMVTAQVAVIEDENGIVDVHIMPKTKSGVIYQLKKDQVFWVGEDHYGKESDWSSVYIPKNNFSFKSTENNFLKGYVLRNSIKPLNEKEQYLGKALTFEYITQAFSEKNKVIDYHEGTSIVAINGLKPWGIDGKKPSTEIEKINVILNDKKVLVPEIFTSDIYECDNDFDVYKIEETYFVHQWSSEGAGAYEIVWVIKENGIQQRLVGSMHNTKSPNSKYISSY